MTADKLIETFKKENPEFPNYILEETKKHLPAKVTEAQVKKILEKIKEEYEDALINPYEAIGVITAQSVGEPATQMTLNTFHFAGVGSGVEGLPRLIEILDAKKNLKAPIMKIYLNKEGMNDDKFKIVANKIKETKLVDFSNNVDIDTESKKVVITLDLKKLKKLKIEAESLTSFIDKKIRKDVKIEDNKLTISTKASTSLKDLMSIKELALNSVVFGIKGVSDISLIKEKDEYIIITQGVALKQIENIPEVDKFRIYSNDIQKIADNYGIEAARQAIIIEFQEVVKSQGLSINERHLLLIADIMTYTGEVKGMTRYGIVNDKENVLTRASFETPLKHIAKGAFQNEENYLNTITENVMTNQIVRVGTGIPKIAVKKGE